MSIYDKDLFGKNKIENATDRIIVHKPTDNYYVAYSGGKDSDAVLDITILSGMGYDAHYSASGCDPPELVQHIRIDHPEVAFERAEVGLFKAIEKKGMPRRQARWCCELIKEKHGSGRTVITGLRWGESSRRKQRGLYELCKNDGTKHFLNPIIDWTDDDVWEYIHSNNLPYCSLYDEGFKRLGCVLCPMETPRQTALELKRFPKIAEAWKRACYRYWHKQGKGVQHWKNPEAFWQWWLSRKGEPKIDDRQCLLFDN